MDESTMVEKAIHKTGLIGLKTEATREENRFFAAICCRSNSVFYVVRCKR